MADEAALVVEFLQGILSATQSTAIGSAVRDQIYAADAFVRMAAELQRIGAAVKEPQTRTEHDVVQAFEDALSLAKFTLRKIAESTLKEDRNG